MRYLLVAVGLKAMHKKVVTLANDMQKRPLPIVIVIVMLAALRKKRTDETVALKITGRPCKCQLFRM